MIPIEGVTLLETITMQAPVSRIIGLCFGILSAIVILCIAILDKGPWIPTIAVFMLDVILITVCITQLIEGPFIRYKVRMDDYAALPQVVEYYDIVKSEGNIWYLEEKDGK